MQICLTTGWDSASTYTRSCGLLVSCPGPPTSSWNFLSSSRTNHLLLIPVSGWASRTRFISVTPSWVQVRWCLFLFLFGTSNLEGEGWVFSNFITQDKNSVRWNWRNSTLAMILWDCPFDCYGAVMLGAGALHGWELEDLASPRGLNHLHSGLGRGWAFVGTLSQDWKIFRFGHFCHSLFVVTGSALFHVCRCSFQNECYSCISSLEILNIPVVKSICDCLKFSHFVESECALLLLILWSILLSDSICVEVLVSSGLLLRGLFCFLSLYSLLSAPQITVVSIWPNGTSHVALPLPCWYYHPIRAIPCPGIGPASTALSSPSQNCCCCHERHS